MQSLESRGWRYLEERFGIDRKDVPEHDLKEKSGDLWLVSSNFYTYLKVETHGIRILRNLDIGLKPTTYGLQILGDKIKRNKVALSEEETIKMMKRKDMVDRELDNEGYVALKYQSRIIGCGFYKNGKVSSRVPKGRGKELSEIIED